MKEKIMACRYVRRDSKGHWEYGVCRVENIGLKAEKREHIPEGTAKTYHDACLKNDMALHGASRTGSRAENYTPNWK